MSYEILKKHRETWNRKKVLQRIYTGWYQRIIGNMILQGPTLEIGGGGGNLKEFYPDLISSDFTFCPWLDVNLDGHHLPFLSNSLANIVVIDVLHHLAKPVNFIREAQRVLKKDGRLLMFEPCISPASYLIYNYLHQEDVDFSPDVFSEEMWGGGDLKNPFDGNMAIPTSMFLRQAEKFRKYFPDFKIIETSCSDYFIYPLSGGFEHPNLIPGFFLPVMRFFERCMDPVGSFFAFRLLVVLANEKNGK